MTYYESAAGVQISQDRALQELRRHGLDSDQDKETFFAECGRRATYRAQAVLEWLGY